MTAIKKRLAKITLRRLVRAALIMSLLSFILLFAFALYIYHYGQTDRAAPADVIIVLGAGTRPSGAPSPSHKRRIEHAVALYQKGIAPYVLCTGGFTANHPNSEAEACVQSLQGMGVPASAILREDNSRSTEENALEAQKVMLAHNLKTAVLVSDNYHLWRAEMLFRVRGITVYPSPAQVTTGTLYWRTAVQNTTRELLATGWYLFKSLLGLPVTDL